MACALIAAGGTGTRFGGPRPKQYLPLAGAPVLARTLQVFDGCAAISRLVLVVPAQDIAFCRESIVAPAGLRKGVSVTAGGDTRQESVWRGLAQAGADEEIVAIHDAVRPMVTPAAVCACVEAARRHGASVLGVPAWDTLKQANASGSVVGTLPREGVWLAQTPQVFRVGLIRAAHANARADGYLGTDDAALVERMGLPVRLVAGSRLNIKITTPEDLRLAEFFFELERSGAGRTP